MNALYEFRYAIRRLRSSPTFTMAATLTLAIAIGATASVFSLVDGVLLKAFPYHHPDRVLAIWESNPRRNLPKMTVSPLNFLDYRSENRTFTALAAVEDQQATVTGHGVPERLSALVVTPSYFLVFGITPVLGRPLAEDSAGPSEVVIGYGYWQQRFAGSRAVLHQTLILDGHPYTIVGVMPPGLPDDADLWVRLGFGPTDLGHRDWHYLLAYGRLRPGVTAVQGEQDLQAIARRLAQSYPTADANWSVLTVPLVDQLVGTVRLPLIVLLCAAACVLLIGAANLANLFLVRNLRREREVALRSALGATRGRVIGELLAEAVTLAGMAGALGVGVAVAGVRVLRALAPTSLPRLGQTHVDARVVAFCALASAATVLVFGLLPGLQTSRGELTAFLKEGGRETGSARQNRVQDGFVVLQVAVALVLLTTASLFVETFGRFEHSDQGFRPAGVLTARLYPSMARYSTPERTAQFASSLTERLRALPGVEAAGASSELPGSTGTMSGFTLVGVPVSDPSQMPHGRLLFVTPDYFRAMGMPLESGRGVLPTDDSRGVKVAVVDQLGIERYFGGRNPIGMQLALGQGLDSNTVTIVGVVATVRQGGLSSENLPWLYIPLAQAPGPGYLGDVVVRTAGHPDDQIAAVKRVIGDLDPTMPVYDIKTMQTRLAATAGATRFATFLTSLFAVIALALGMIGIYSVLAYIVTQRQRDIGIRLALGANRQQIMTPVLGHAFALTLTGVAIGTVLTWVATRGLSALLVGVSPHDPRAFVGGAAAFALVALVAAAVPAFRTTRIDPVLALTST